MNLYEYLNVEYIYESQRSNRVQIGIEEENDKISMEEKERKSYLMLIDTYLIFNVLIK